MTISERVLRKWRLDAFYQLDLSKIDADFEFAKMRKETSEKILRLTEELLERRIR